MTEILKYHNRNPFEVWALFVWYWLPFTIQYLQCTYLESTG